MATADGDGSDDGGGDQAAASDSTAFEARIEAMPVRVWLQLFRTI
jgi:hypothetical protein